MNDLFEMIDESQNPPSWATIGMKSHRGRKGIVYLFFDESLREETAREMSPEKAKALTGIEWISPIMYLKRMASRS